MENDKRLENIVAKDKGYSAPRCAYCTDEIKEEDDAKFSTLSDGNKYPVHKECHEENEQVPTETREELTARIKNWTEHTSEIEKELNYRTHTNGKRVVKHLISALIPGSTFYERFYERIRDGPDDYRGVNPFSPLFNLQWDIIGVPITIMALSEHNFVAAATCYLTVSALKPVTDYLFRALDTTKLKKRATFAKDYSSHLQEKLAQIPADDKTDKKTSSD